MAFRWQHFIVAISGAVSLLSGAGSLRGDDAAFFESRIRPLLHKHCYRCHGADDSPGGNLRLDTRAGWMAGGENGPAIVPGKPDESRLIEAVRYRSPNLQMPPVDEGGKLSEQEIADLVEWVRTGAYDPREASPTVPSRRSWDELYAERKEWWSLQPPKHSQPSALQDPEWNSLIDRFLRSAMSAAGVTPSGRAVPETLIRRVTLVLTGLPPTPAQVQEFVAASRVDADRAYQDLVDRLLDSPQFGERFARHWMDVVRFTETHGNEWNYDVPYAWRYRDYLIRAFNDDVPYDQFVREHVAGDLLTSPRLSADGLRNESAIATAFYRFGEVNHDSCVEFSVIGYDIVDNQLDTLTKAFQSLTVACARCHDHKLDAVSTRDYHALLGVLRNSRSVMKTLDGPEFNRQSLLSLQQIKTELRSELARTWQEVVQGWTLAQWQAIAEAVKPKPPGAEDPFHPWLTVHLLPSDEEVAATWTQLGNQLQTLYTERAAWNTAQYTTLADFRQGIPADWFQEGTGLRDPATGASSPLPKTGGDFTVATEGDAAVSRLFPASVSTFSLSSKLNGAIRSPTLKRTHSHVSMEVLGGRFSLSRLVFNNCQLNYNHQHSIHHDQWSWITIPFPEKTDSLLPYLEFLTFWDNPKFPDPLGTLGKDVENQRNPFADHAQNPRTWWGLRRVVLHNGAEAPRDDQHFLTALYAGEPLTSKAAVLERYRQIAKQALAAFAESRATDDDVRWINWFMALGVLPNAQGMSPRMGELVGQYRQQEQELSLPSTMPTMADEGTPQLQPVFIRGDHTQPGPGVAPAYVQVLQRETKETGNGSGRRELAELLASAENPLTARVFVNRAWQWTFGRGLVGTPDDFGHLGELPSHPELLDHLAHEFVEQGWSVRQLLRSLVMSRAFQGASANEAARLSDPENRLLARYRPHRAEAEVIRDSLLAVSGRLDATLGGPSIHPFRETADTEKRLYTGPLDGIGRRSVYLKVQLMEAPRFLSAFNLPGGKVATGRREASNTPAQSLAMLNDPLVRHLADVWATRLVADGGTSPTERVEKMLQAALGRSADSQEREQLLEVVRSIAAEQAVLAEELMASQVVWANVAHLLFNLQEFVFIP